VTFDSSYQRYQLIYLRNTALAFAYIENLVTGPDMEFAVATSLSMLESTKEKLGLAGIQQLVYDDFYDEFVHLIKHMVEPNLDTITKKEAVLLTAFQNLSGILDLSSHISAFELKYLQFPIRLLCIYDY
jgi:hypothetical protein